jgi:hypothetical protein
VLVAPVTVGSAGVFIESPVPHKYESDIPSRVSVSNSKMLGPVTRKESPFRFDDNTVCQSEVRLVLGFTSVL